MANRAVVVLGVIVVVVGGALVYDKAKSQAAAPAHQSITAPPSDAEYTDDGPKTIIGAGGVAGHGPPQTHASDAYLGMWNREPWEGECVNITDEKQGPALRIEVRDSTVVGGSYFIIAIVGDNHGVTKGETVQVQGRISDVRTVVVPDAASVISRIVLDPAIVVSHHN